MKRVTLLLLAVLLLAAILTPVLANCASCPEAKAADCAKAVDCEMMKDGVCEDCGCENCPEECEDCDCGCECCV